MKKSIKIKKEKTLTPEKLLFFSGGFTLIEIMIAVVVVMIVFIPMYTFYSNSIRFDTESRYEIIASNLAQEGVELCRNGRDNKILSEGAFFNLYEFDKIEDCTDGDKIKGTFSFSGGSFTRTCSIAVNSYVRKVSCKVEWESFAQKGDALTRSVTAEVLLTDWPSIRP